MTPLNVLGTPLVACSFDPITGFFRDGCCNTDAQDQGTHVACAQVTAEFLAKTVARARALKDTPRAPITTPTLNDASIESNGT
jgi:uncharacterized protein (DUF2237 family)